ncbi:delta tubulin, putative [Trypanosoma cruzi marinkellei]|uniref:Tubulin delta chain n=1 Tax=Trypanosoma cruzi marinkellei TaxID=85056 RepID=K2M257_TRYCR|nr:delta tubulin, putative [Trypanosoma cruzi marinkellei]
MYVSRCIYIHMYMYFLFCFLLSFSHFVCFLSFFFFLHISFLKYCHCVSLFATRQYGVCVWQRGGGGREEGGELVITRAEKYTCVSRVRLCGIHSAGIEGEREERMACVHVLVGQCGNQLGTQFLDNLVAEAYTSDEDDGFAAQVSSLHFRPSPMLRGSELNHGVTMPPLPRCVMIDMEPKVIEGILNNTKNGGAYRPHVRQCITRDEGSANNWACGYFQQGSSRKEEILDSLRRESESSGTVSTFHVVHSIAGGTGSGVGCLVADAIREEFPFALLLHSVVWPFSTGEVVTQWYNCVMAMSALRDTADAIFMAHNDDFGDAAVFTNKKKAICDVHRGEVSFTRINDDISRLLVDMHLPQNIYRVTQPTTTALATTCNMKRHRFLHPQALQGAEEVCSHTSHAGVLRRGSVADLVESVALDPALKFFSGVSLPNDAGIPSRGGGGDSSGGGAGVKDNSLSWGSVMRHAARKSAELFPPFTGRYTGGVLQQRPFIWSLRGSSVCSEGITALQEVTSSPSYTGIALLHEKRYRGYTAHVSLFGPTCKIGIRLSKALERTEQLLSVRAFIHHFNRYGVEVDDVRDAVVRLWDTATIYTSS